MNYVLHIKGNVILIHYVCQFGMCQSFLSSRNEKFLGIDNDKILLCNDFIYFYLSRMKQLVI